MTGSRIHFKERCLASAGAFSTGFSALAFGAWMHLRAVAGDLRRAASSPRQAPRLIVRMSVRWLQWPIDSLLIFGGRMLATVQILLGAEVPGRALTPAERALAGSVFGGSLDVAGIRVKQGRAGLLGISGRPFALGEFIYVPPGRALSARLLLHELVHVWQFQRGGLGYLTAAIWAQTLGGGYDYASPLRREIPWADWNPEQQAQWVEDAFSRGDLPGAQTPLAREVMASISSGIGAT